MSNTASDTAENITIDTLRDLLVDIRRTLAESQSEKPDLEGEVVYNRAPYLHPIDRQYYTELQLSLHGVLRHYTTHEQWEEMDIVNDDKVVRDVV